MDIQTEKIAIVKRLLDTDDELILQQVKDVLNSHETDWWDMLGAEEKEGIEEGLRQADRGELTPHEEVMAKYSKWLTK